MNSAIKNMELKDMITLRTWMVVASVLTVIVVLSIQEAVIQLALPIISKDLNVAYSSLSIIITGYWLTYGVSSLPLGKLGDLLSHRLIFLLASIMLGGLSILCGVIPSWESLAIFRTLAGVCVAALTANGVSILRSSFGEGRRAQVTSLWAATISLSFIVGPSLGGVFIDFAKWEYIFTLGGILCIAIPILLAIVLPKSADTKLEADFDYLGACLIALFMGSLIITLNSLRDSSFSNFDPKIIVSLTIFVISLTIFIRYERKIPNPVIRFSSFRNKQYTFALLCGVSYATSVQGLNYLLQYYLQKVAGFTTSTSGTLWMLMSVATLISNIALGRGKGKLTPNVTFVQS